MKTLGLTFCFSLLLRCVMAQETALLPMEQRTNGAATLDALSMIQSAVKRSVAQVLDEKGSPAQLAVVVSEDGYLLTKASEAPNHENISVVWFDGKQDEATVVLIDRANDLLLAHVAKSDAVPITWSDQTEWPRGTWLCAFDHGTPKSPSLPLRLGNISANRRSVVGHRAAMGIGMENDDRGEAVRINEIGADSPAQKAGLQRDDLILAIDDTKVTSVEFMQQELDGRQPGDRVKLLVQRDQEKKEYTVKLASRSKVVSNWTGEDYANGGVSLRTDNYADVLQHQVPLSPQDMGGPLLDLDGHAIGINIARVDRVTTFAIPVKAFWSKVQQWIVQDRKAAGEEVRSAEVVK